MEGLKKRALDLIEIKISSLRMAPSYFMCDQITGSAALLQDLGVISFEEYVEIRDRCWDCFENAY